MSAAEDAYLGLYDRAIRHRIDLERYGEAELRAMLRFAREVERETLSRVAALQIDPALTRSQRLRLQSLEGLLRELRVLYAEAYLRLRDRVTAGLEDLAAFEAEFQTRSLRAALSDLGLRAAGRAEALGGELRILTPTTAQLAAIVRTRPLFMGQSAKLLSEWLDDLESNHRTRIEGVLRRGVLEGQGAAALRDAVLEVGQLNARGAEALVRTAVTQIATEVAQEGYQLSGDLVRQIEWVSTLDSRTTPVCRARDGERYPVDAGPRPPAHVRCRSTVIPVLADFPPPRRETYGSWLRRQDAETQDDILGPARAQMFRGGADLAQFVTPQGRPLTLAQMRRRMDDDIPF